MTLKPLLILTGFLCLCTLPLACANPPTGVYPHVKSGEIPRVNSGEIDLKGWNPVEQPEISLDGDWHFNWKELSHERVQTPVYFPVPGFWNDSSAGPLRLSGEGYAVYALQIKNGNSDPLAVRVLDMESAFELYANGRRIASNGTVGRSAAEEIPEWKPLVSLLPQAEETNLVLVVSNFHHRLGGIWQGLRLGKAEHMFTAQRDATALELFLAGSLLMIAVYHCMVFFVRRQEKVFLLLGIFCSIMALRTLVTGERYLVHLFPAMSWDLLIRLDYLTVSIGMVVNHWQLRIVFQKYYNRFVFLALAIIFGACAFAEIVLPPKIFSHLLSVHSIVVALWSVYFLVISFIAMIRRMPGAAVIWAGWIIAIAAVLHDILFVDSFVKSRYLLALGLQAFVLTQSYYLANQYAKSFSLSELLGRRMKSLLTLTRDLNRSGERDAAIWTALAEIQKVTGAIAEKSAAYVPLRDAGLLQKIRPQSPPEPISLEFSERLLNLKQNEIIEDRIRIPVSTAERCLCVLEIFLPGKKDSADASLPDSSYTEGILDSLRLVLDNIERVQKDELAWIGQTAAEIVHDINHHCQVIENLAQSRSENNPEETMNNISQEVTYMKNLAHDVLDYARERLIVSPRPHDVSDISSLIEKDLQEVFHNTSIHPNVVLSASGKLRVDLDRFRRVVRNLAVNALAALGDRGHFTVTIENQADSCCFLFEDDGPGVSESVADRLFEPFTTSGRGAGLGLAVVKRIVQAHGGDVRVNSSPGQGCRFLVEVPAA